MTLKIVALILLLGTIAAPLALLRAEIVLKRDVCSTPPPLCSKKRPPNFGAGLQGSRSSRVQWVPCTALEARYHN